jgi:hypothetical protein
MPFVDALTLSATTGVTCRLAMGDISLAHHQANALASELKSMLGPVGVASVLQSELIGRNVKISNSNFATEAQKLEGEVKQQVSAYREREECTASLPLTIQRVNDLGLDEREFLNQARNEKDEALLLLLGES